MGLSVEATPIALEQLIEKHQTWWPAPWRACLGANSDVEDIAQQVFIRVWKKRRVGMSRGQDSRPGYWKIRVISFSTSYAVQASRACSTSAGSGVEDPPLKDERTWLRMFPAGRELQRTNRRSNPPAFRTQRMALVLRRYEQLIMSNCRAFSTSQFPL